MQEQVIERVHYLLISVIQENKIVISLIHYLLIFQFMNIMPQTPPVRASLGDPWRNPKDPQGLN